MKRIVSGLALVLTMLISSVTTAATTTFRATMSGPGEQPPNNSPGAGIATVVFDNIALTMRFSVPFFDLVAGTVAGHLHCCTAAPLIGTAPVAIGFGDFPTGARAGLYEQVFDLTAAASYPAAFIDAHGGTVDTARNFLLSGVANNQSYLNIHTSTYPGGEIRGFLVATPVPEPAAWLMLGVGLLGLGLGARRPRIG